MNIWVRVTSRIRIADEIEKRSSDGSLKLTPELRITVYRSKENAEQARRILGGILLEVNATSLGLESQNELGKELISLPDESGEARSPSFALFGVCEKALARTSISKGRAIKDLADRQTLSWLKALEKDTGFEIFK